MFAQRTILGLVTVLAVAGLLALMMSQAVEGTFAGGKGKKPPPEPEPPLAGSIYFNNRSTGTAWVMDPDGGNKREVLDKTILVRYTPQDVIHDELTPWFLVNNPGNDSDFPELFAVTKHEGHESHGVHALQLTDLPDVRVKQLARWSPDGNYVAFSFVRGVDWQIAVGRVRDENGLISPSTFIEMPIDGTYLAWSPDNKRLVYHYANSIYVSTVVNELGMIIPFLEQADPMKLLGTELDDRNKGSLDWSSSGGCAGGRIVFAMSPPGETRSKDLYTGCIDSDGLSLDGTGLVQVTSVKAKTTNGNAGWSPDGEHMVYVAYNTAKFEFDIHRIKADGSGAVNLSKDTKGGVSNVGWRD